MFRPVPSQKEKRPKGADGGRRRAKVQGENGKEKGRRCELQNVRSLCLAVSRFCHYHCLSHSCPNCPSLRSRDSLHIPLICLASLSISPYQAAGIFYWKTLIQYDEHCQKNSLKVNKSLFLLAHLKDFRGLAKYLQGNQGLD